MIDKYDDLSYDGIGGELSYDEELQNMIRPEREKNINECNCRFYAKKLYGMNNSLYKYVCQKCGLKFYSHEVLKEHGVEEKNPRDKAEW